MTNKYLNTYRIQSTRLQNWDYSWNGAYFVTICTKNRTHYFGIIDNKKIFLSDIGKYALKFWYEIPKHFKNIQLGNFIIMPNHIHGIIIIDNQFKTNDSYETRQCLVSTAQLQNNVPGNQRFQNQGKQTISSIIGSYKSVVSKNAHSINPEFGWQSRFHDYIIRNNHAYVNISNYIKNNPDNWKSDCFYQ